MHVHVQFSQSTSKLAFQNIMNYLRLLLFFFVLLAPLQLTEAGIKEQSCYKRCKNHIHDSNELREQNLRRDCYKWCYANCNDDGNAHHNCMYGDVIIG